MGKIKQWNIYTAANKMYYVLSNITIAVLVFFYTNSWQSILSAEPF